MEGGNGPAIPPTATTPATTTTTTAVTAIATPTTPTSAAAKRSSKRSAAAAANTPNNSNSNNSNSNSSSNSGSNTGTSSSGGNGKTPASTRPVMIMMPPARSDTESPPPPPSQSQSQSHRESPPLGPSVLSVGLLLPPPPTSLPLEVPSPTTHHGKPASASSRVASFELSPAHDRLMALFGAIEREFQNLYEENQQLKNELQFLREESSSRGADLKTLQSSQKGETISGRLRASTPKISNSFKALYRSQWVKFGEYIGHRDGVWEIASCPHHLNLFGTASADRTARLWHVWSNQYFYNYAGHKGSVNSIQFHPKDAIACSGSGDGTCHIWRVPPVVLNSVEKLSNDAQEAMKASEREREENPKKASEMARFNHIGAADVANLSGKAPLTKLMAHSDVVISVDWLATGNRIVTGSWDTSIRVWDVGQAQQQSEILAETQKLVGHEQKITHVAAHPADDLIVSTSKDRTIRIWDLRKPAAPVHTSKAHIGSVTSAVFSKLGSYFVTGSDDSTIKVWDIKFMKAPVTNIRCGSGVNKLSISPVASTIAVPLDNGEVRFFDLSGGRIARIARSPHGHQRNVCCTSWISDESKVLTCGFTEAVFSWMPSENY